MNWGCKILDEGVQMHTLLFLPKPCPVRLCGDTRLTIGRGVQGGASLDCIRIIGKGEILLTILSSLSQEETRRKREGGRYSGVSIFSGKIKCGECGGSFGAKVWHSTDKYRRVICRFDEVTEAIAQRSAKGERLAGFIRTLEAQGEPVAEFDERLWGAMVDYVTVGVDGGMTVVFRDGTERRL